MIPQRYYKYIAIGGAFCIALVLFALTIGDDSPPVSPLAEPTATPRPTWSMDPAPTILDSAPVMQPGDEPGNYVEVGGQTPQEVAFELQHRIEVRVNNSVTWSRTVTTGVQAPSTLGTGPLSNAGLPWPSNVIGEQWECSFWHAQTDEAAARLPEVCGGLVCDESNLYLIIYDDGTVLPTDGRGCYLTGHSGYTVYLTTIERK